MNETAAIQKLKNLVKKERADFLFSALAKTFAVWFLCVFVFSAFEALFRFGKDARTLMFALFALCAVLSFVKFALPALSLFFRKITFSDILDKAQSLGENFPEIKDELANALELARNQDENFSEELIKAAVNRALSLLPEKFFDVRKTKRRKETLANLFVIFSVALAFAALPALRGGAFRISHFTREFRPPQKFFFEVSPRDTVIAKGDTLTLAVKIIGEMPRSFTLYIKNKGDADFTPKRKFKTSRKKYFHEIRKIETPFRYFFFAENVSSDTFSVSVVNPPFVREINATVYPPKYTGEKSFTIAGDGNVSALRGSLVRLKITTNKAPQSAKIRFSYGKEIPLEISGKKLGGEFRIVKKGAYKIELVDSLGYTNRYPISYSVDVIEDEPPAIRILLPGKDIDLGNENTIPLAIKISDDYGFRKVLLKYRLAHSEFKKSEENFSVISLPFTHETEQTVFYDWNVLPLNIEVNDVYEYFAEVYDNDTFGGPKKAVSKTYKIHLPPLEEFLAKTEKENLKSLEEFKKTLQEAEQLKKEMEKLSYDLKKNKAKISWDEKKKLQSASEKFKKLAERAEKLKERLAKQQSDLQKRNMLSPETLRKYEELQKLLSKMNDETLRKALQKMNNSLDKMRADDVRKSLEELKKNEEAFRKSIERTIELFKRLLAEQKTDELLKRMEAIEKEQSKISNEMKNSPSNKKLDELTKKQADLKKKLADLQKEAEDLAKTMKDLEDMPASEMEKLAEEMKNQKNDELAEKAAENMMMRNNEQAQQMQNQIMQNMAQMKRQMRNVQNQMRMQNQMKTMAEMMRLTREIIALSQKEERLKNEISSSDLSNAQIRKLAAEQNETMLNLDMLLKRMQSLSKKTFAITPEMGNALGKARSQMRQTIGDLENRSRNGAQNKSRGAMAALNEAAEMMQSMLNAMANQQGQGEGGMMSLMQQLKKMSGMQMQINAQTKQMKGMGKSQRQLARMQRLAAQQQALQKSLEELDKEAKASGKSKQLAADLERIAEEMKEIVSDLQSANLDDDLIKKQERILSRLLDAQRSINERDFEKRRQSKAGKNVARKSPKDLRLGKEAKDRLEKELLEAEKEGYKNDYRELIRKYYRELQKENK